MSESETCPKCGAEWSGFHVCHASPSPLEGMAFPGSEPRYGPAPTLDPTLAKLPMRNIRRCIAIIEAADNRCATGDGPVPPTWSEMSRKEIQLCLSTLWDCRAAAEAAKVTGEAQ